MIIRRVWIEWDHDQTSDARDLGAYSDTPGPDAIDQQEHGVIVPLRIRYFTPALTAEQTGNPDSPMQDYLRAEAFNRGDLYFESCRAAAEVQSRDGGVIQRIKSGGLYGIESDSGKAYFTEVEDEELATLANELASFGFDASDVGVAISNAESRR